MNRTAFIVVIVLVAAIAVAGVVMLLPGDKGNGTDSDIQPGDSDDPVQTSGKLKIRNTLEVGDWVTLTIPCKGNPFVMKLTVESIDGDVANLSAEYDASHKYAKNLDHLAKFNKVWTKLDATDDKMAGLYPIIDDGTHSSVPMFFKNWSEEAKEAVLKSDGKYAESGGKEFFAEIELKSYSTPRGERSCIVYDASGVITEAEFLKYEGREDFTYRDFADNFILDYELGIVWKDCGFGPIELDSSIYTYE